MRAGKLQNSEDVENRGKKGSLVMMKNEDGNAALHVAVRNEKINVVKTLIKDDIELCYCLNKDNETPLFIAVEGGFFDIASYIISEHPSVPFQGTNGMNALHTALICTHHEREVENQVPDLSLKNIRRIPRDVLLRIQECVGVISVGPNRYHKCAPRDPQRRKVMISHPNEFGWYSIHYAAHLDHFKATRLLLGKDSSIAYNLNKNKMIILHLAAKEGNVNIIKKLVDKSKRIALHLAGKNGETKVVRYILKDLKLEGIINVPDENENIFLHLAVICD
ncbi:Ankyrin repeat [Dillenia turbinata]|uniref:Ankyrin repeat n=1 Tax=Dillenia turbinata TaxID=194707 RepID=A0AAN8ZJF2_9MAGN